MSLRKIIFSVIILLLVVVFIKTSVQFSNRVNTEMRGRDQSAYMAAVKKIHQSDNYWYLGDRNRMPLYNYFQALFYDSEMSDEAFFQQGKLLNIFLSLGLVGGIYWLVSGYLEIIQARMLTLIVGMTLFLMKAGFFQVENMFYFLFFAAFILLLRTIAGFQIRVAAWAGVVAGLAYLAKASMLLGIQIYVLFVLGLGVYALFGKRYSKWFSQLKLPKIYMGKVVFSSMVLLLTFLATISFYVWENKKVFGHYFYNVNSTFYVWYDNGLDDAKKGTAIHGDTVGWPQMPESEIPSMGKYLRSHSWQQVVTRLSLGLRTFVGIWIYPYSDNFVVTKYVWLYGTMLGWWVWRGRRKHWPVVRDNLLVVGFWFVFMGIYTLGISWYGIKPRFVLALFLPVLFSLLVALERLKIGDYRITIGNYRMQLINLFHIGVLFCLEYDVIKMMIRMQHVLIDI